MTGELDVLGVDNVLLAVGDLELALELYEGKLRLPLKSIRRPSHSSAFAAW